MRAHGCVFLRLQNCFFLFGCFHTHPPFIIDWIPVHSFERFFLRQPPHSFLFLVIATLDPCATDKNCGTTSLLFLLSIFDSPYLSASCSPVANPIVPWPIFYSFTFCSIRRHRLYSVDRCVLQRYLLSWSVLICMYVIQGKWIQSTKQFIVFKPYMQANYGTFIDLD